jgi:two-component system response regulator RegA
VIHDSCYPTGGSTDLTDGAVKAVGRRQTESSCSVKASPKLLIVDADWGFSRAVQQVFRRQAWEVTAVPLLPAQPNHDLAPDLVIMDICPEGRPRLDGLSSVLRSAPRAKVVALTAYPSLRLAVDATKAGAMDCIAKPVTPAELYRSLRLDLSAPAPERPLRLPSLAKMEWDYIARIFSLTNQNVSLAARTLGIERSTLQRKLKKRPPLW